MRALLFTLLIFGLTTTNAFATDFSTRWNWNIDVHDGEKNGWRIDKVHAREISVREGSRRQQLRDKFEALLEKNEAKKFLPKDAKNALKIGLETLDKIENPTDRNGAFWELREIIAAFNYNFEFPVPQKIWVGKVPIRAIEELRGHKMMVKDAPLATNLWTNQREGDPTPSSFWQPRDIASADFFNGFGRDSIPNLSPYVCEYIEPKTSYGTHGGFTMDCNGTEWKIKFGNETHSEPFNSRLIHALGYNVRPVDFADKVKIKYARGIITEYNKRADMKIKVTSLLGFSYMSYNLQKWLDPFEDAIASAVLTDGREITSRELKKLLMPNGKIQESFESQIAHLVLRPGSIEKKRKGQKDLGAWSWNDFDHPDRRELRGFGIVSAFVNMFDVRTDNTALTYLEDEKRYVHVISDVGSGHGTAKRIFKFENGELNDFPWDLVMVKGGRVKFQNYGLIQKNLAFERMQREDARWMIRKLASISDIQIEAALIASGYSAAEVKIMAAKFASRRKQLLHAFDLEIEAPFKAFASVKIDRNFNYDPREDERPFIETQGAKVQAPVGTLKVRNGALVRM